MDEATRVIRSELLQIVGAVGTIRDRAKRLPDADVRYLERELDAIQATAHRLFEHLDQLALPTA
jgi:hypothetical protein